MVAPPPTDIYGKIMQTNVMKKDKLQRWLQIFSGRQDIILALVMLMAIVMITLPLPTFVVDILIAINLAFSIILLLFAIYINDPLELSVFPSLLLITTLYRLSLTISTSRLVLLQHNAGDIIDAFGRFMVGGNLTVGLVIFSIITIVQFIVITKGTERVAEVSARFSLDGMPGKQMSIDGDMRAGVIDADQARQLRLQVQQESRFLGAMDGAMKFVKGDAIASIIVVLVNILGGVTIAVVQYGMSLGEAVQTYSVLSIGDGLCGQIPSLLISLSAGIIVTRVPGEKRQNLGRELSAQLGKQPHALILAAIVMLLFAVIPGFPFFCFFIMAVLTALPCALLWYRSRHPQSAPVTQDLDDNDLMIPGALPLTLCVSPGLYSDSLSHDIDALRKKLFDTIGVPLPDVSITVDASVAENTLSVLVYQEPVFSLTLPLAAACMIFTAPGEPGFAAETQVLPKGMGSVSWLSAAEGQRAHEAGQKVFTGDQCLIALLQKVLVNHMAEFIGVQEARYLMDAMEKGYAELVKELQRQMPINKIAEVLQRLVSERVSIRDLRLVFGTLIEWAPREKDVQMLTEYVRIALRRHILHRLMPVDAPLRVLRIGEEMENRIRESIRQTSMGTYTALSHSQSAQILRRVTEAQTTYGEFVIVTSVDVRRFLRKVIEQQHSEISVLSWQEVGEHCLIQVVHSIDLDSDPLSYDES